MTSSTASCSERYEEGASFAQFEPGQVATPSIANGASRLRLALPFSENAARGE
jgi:hypothetical protein